MAEYIEISQLWKCETCFHHQNGRCSPPVWCDHGESYRPAYEKLKKADVAPVEHGRWINHSDKGRFMRKFFCDLCGQVDDIPTSSMIGDLAYLHRYEICLCKTCTEKMSIHAAALMRLYQGKRERENNL